MVNRTSFLIDGFNLYHSLKNASDDLGLMATGTKWLNIRSLCESYLAAIGGNAQVEELYYYSAFANHRNARDPGVLKRQKVYINCLEATGLTVQMFRFKKRKIVCPKCVSSFTRHEEKETDVAIGAKLLELLFLDKCDTGIIVSGDTDVIPAVRTAQSLFPHKRIGFLLPYKRLNQELANLAPGLHFAIREETYMRHQFPDPLVLSSGKIMKKPTGW
jgi:uncharacterized LabA/DUF88 family protein